MREQCEFVCEFGLFYDLILTGANESNAPSASRKSLIDKALHLTGKTL
jgi:hypothetical protein